MRRGYPSGGKRAEDLRPPRRATGVRPISRDLVFRDPEDKPTEWWCPTCEEIVPAWHDSCCTGDAS